MSLRYFDNLNLWFSQSILFIVPLLEVSSNPIKELIVSNYSLDLWIILKLIHKLGIFLISLFNIFNLNNIIFLVFCLINFKIILSLKENFLNKTVSGNKILYISLLGFFGFAQSFHSYEIFRIINSTIGIFVAGIYFAKYQPQTKFFKINFSRIGIIIAFCIYASIIFFSFSMNLFIKEFKKLNNTDYVKLDNNFFGDKKIKINAANYYAKLSDIVCLNNFKIINFSPDFAITYLCNNKISSQPYPYNHTISQYNKNLMPQNLQKIFERIFFEGIIEDNEIILTTNAINTSQFKNIVHVGSLHTGHDLNLWHLPRIINIYKSQN